MKKVITELIDYLYKNVDELSKNRRLTAVVKTVFQDTECYRVHITNILPLMVSQNSESYNPHISEIVENYDDVEYDSGSLWLTIYK